MRTLRLLSILGTALLSTISGAEPASAALYRTPYQTCQMARATSEYARSTHVISDADKEPPGYLNVRRGATVLVASEPDAWIDTSPDQWLFPNGAWTAVGNYQPAPDDWLLPGASQFAVTLEGWGPEPIIVGAKSACVEWPYDDAYIGYNVGLNVVQWGHASPLTNRWRGAIGVHVMIFS